MKSWQFNIIFVGIACTPILYLFWYDISPLVVQLFSFLWMGSVVAIIVLFYFKRLQRLALGILLIWVLVFGLSALDISGVRRRDMQLEKIQTKVLDNYELKKNR